MVNLKPNDRAYQRCCGAQNLYDNIKRLNLDVEKLAPIRGRVDTWEHFPEYLGKSLENAAWKRKPGYLDFATSCCGPRSRYSRPVIARLPKNFQRKLNVP
jgi:hypothetical protein